MMEAYIVDMSASLEKRRISMNYIKQLNMLKQYLEHHELPSVAILLWHTLMLINNRTGWKKSFNAPQVMS